MAEQKRRVLRARIVRRKRHPELVESPEEIAAMLAANDVL